MSLWQVFQSEPSWLEYVQNYSYIDIPNHADFIDLGNHSFTMEGYYAITYHGLLIAKTPPTISTNFVGWYATVIGTAIVFRIRLFNDYLIGSAYIFTSITAPYDLVDNTFHHMAFQCYQPPSTHPTLHVYLDGVLLTPHAGYIDHNYLVSSDALIHLYIAGYQDGGTNPYPFNSGLRVGWQRLSNIARYMTNFTPDSINSPPGIDANTLGQWNMTDGIGTVLDNAEGNVAKDGTLVNGVWYGVEAGLNL